MILLVTRIVVGIYPYEITFLVKKGKIVRDKYTVSRFNKDRLDEDSSIVPPRIIKKAIQQGEIEISRLTKLTNQMELTF